MNFRCRVFFLAIPLAGLAAGCLPGCTSKVQDPPAALKPGSLAFQFDPKATQAFSIFKQDPDSGTPWSVDLVRVGDHWEVRAASSTLEWGDRLANSPYLEHVLDSLNSLKVQDLAPPASEATLGLTPPRFRLEWDASGTRHSLQLGAPAPLSGTYARIGAQTVIVRGSVVPLLGHATGLDFIRLQRLLPIDLDDVQEVAWKGSGRTVIAQRLSGGWADDKLRPHSEKMRSALDALIHIRISHFIDNPKEAEALQGKLVSPWAECTFKDRRDVPTSVQFYRLGASLYARTDARPGRVFQLFPETLRLLKPPV